MKIEPLDTREAIRDAIRAHGHAWQEAYDDFLPEDVLDGMTTDPTAEDVDAWLDRLPEEGGVTLGATVDGTARGYVLVRWTNTKPFVRPGEAGLKEIHVHPDWWGDGIGTALFEHACEHIPDDVAGIALEVFADNDVGRRFYESKGFAVSDSGTVDVAGDTYETVIYRRDLDSGAL
ncbi:GNAT family N-acetyltransferase [Halobacteriales archaeon QH_2_65_14]|nr:MAG: GNAT family N-acetyltransferase [Halobacteriales archaeon QH_2_65_14]